MAKGREGSSKSAGTHFLRPFSARDTTSSPRTFGPYPLPRPTIYSQTSSGKPSLPVTQDCISLGNTLAIALGFAPFVCSRSVTFKTS